MVSYEVTLALNLSYDSTLNDPATSNYTDLQIDIENMVRRKFHDPVISKLSLVLTYKSEKNALREDSDQTAHLRSLIRIFTEAFGSHLSFMQPVKVCSLLVRVSHYFKTYC